MSINVNRDNAAEQDKEIVQALWNAGMLTGAEPSAFSKGGSVIVRGCAANYYLLTAVLAVRLAAGDIVLVEKSDKAAKKSYQEKLVEEIRRHTVGK